MNIRTNTISGAEIRAKKKSGMSAEQISRELISSPAERKLKEENKKLNFKIDKLKEENELVSQEESDIMIDRMMLYIKQIKDQRDKLKEENEKLKEENEKIQISLDCHSAELSFIDPNGNLSAMNEYVAFNEYLKDTYSEEKYKNIYEAMELGEHLEESEH